MGSEHQAPGEDTYETGSGQSIFPLPSADTPRRINDSMLDPVGPFLPRARVDNRGGAVATLTSAYVTSSYVTRKSSDPWWEIRDVYVPDAQEEAALIRVELECVETDTGLAFDRRRFSPRQHWQSILLPRSCEEVAMSDRSQHSRASSSLQQIVRERIDPDNRPSKRGSCRRMLIVSRGAKRTIIRELDTRRIRVDREQSFLFPDHAERELRNFKVRYI